MKNFQTITGITFLQFTVFPGRFHSSQVWRDMKSSIIKSQIGMETRASVQPPLQKLVFSSGGQN